MYQHKIDVACSQMHRQDTRSNSDIHPNMELVENLQHRHIDNFQLYLSNLLMIHSRCKHLDLRIHQCQCKRLRCHLHQKFLDDLKEINHNLWIGLFTPSGFLGCFGPQNWGKIHYKDGTWTTLVTNHDTAQWNGWENSFPEAVNSFVLLSTYPFRQMQW